MLNFWSKIKIVVKSNVSTTIDHYLLQVVLVNNFIVNNFFQCVNLLRNNEKVEIPYYLSCNMLIIVSKQRKDFSKTQSM